MAMTMTFLGAAGTVTGSKYLVEIGERRILVDAGMFQGDKEWQQVNWEPFPVPPSSIKEIVLTHAHADHIAFLPALVKEGFRGPVWCTEATRRLAEIILMDAGHLQEREAQNALEGGYSKHNPPLPLYTVADVEQTIPLFKTVPFDTDVDLGGGVAARWTRAGHILGSASVTLAVDGSSVLFSGDLGRHDHPVLRPRDTPPGAPFVLIESTYGDREHPDPDGLPHEAMAEAIRRTIQRGGSVLVPAFAIDRTEIVLRALVEMRDAGRIPADVPIYVNSPMAVAGLQVYREAEAKGELREDNDPAEFFNLPHLSEVTDAEESKRLNRPDRPSIVISSSGMANGGRVLHHLEAMLPDAKNTVIFTGYQGVGTRGRTLLEGATEMKFRGRFVPVKAEIVRDGEFSVHADASDLIDWLRELSPKPETVFCTHGEEGSAEALAAKIRAELDLPVVVPRYKEKVLLDPRGTWQELGALTQPTDQAPTATPARPTSAEPDGGEVYEPGGPGGSLPTRGRSTVPATAAPAATPTTGAPVTTTAPATRTGGDTHADDMDQVQVILDTALGQVAFLPEGKQQEVSELLHSAVELAGAQTPDLASLRTAVNLALYAAAGAVETPGGQSIVALLAHVPKILG